MVGNPAQPAGKDAAARGVPGGRLCRDTAGGRQEREVQADGARAAESAIAAIVGWAKARTRRAHLPCSNERVVRGRWARFALPTLRLLTALHDVQQQATGEGWCD